MWYKKYNAINTNYPLRYALSRPLQYAIHDLVYLGFDPINGSSINYMTKLMVMCMLIDILW